MSIFIFVYLFLCMIYSENKGSEENRQQFSRKSRPHEDEEAGGVKNQDSEMIILGLFREQRQEEIYKDRVNQVNQISLLKKLK